MNRNKTVETGTVLVGCKIPTGLLVRTYDKDNPTVVLDEFKLNGAAMDKEPFVREGGVGITRVPADKWERFEAWARENKYKPFVNGFVFAATDADSVLAEAAEKAKERTMLEGLDVSPSANDPRMKEFSAAPSDKGTLLESFKE